MGECVINWEIYWRIVALGGYGERVRELASISIHKRFMEMSVGKRL